MAWNDEITLIGVTYTDDVLNQKVATETRHTVLCDIQSVTGQEFMDAGRSGIHPDCRARLFFGDYSGQKIAEVNGKRLAVYRTYQPTKDVIELYLEERGGI